MLTINKDKPILFEGARFKHKGNLYKLASFDKEDRSRFFRSPRTYLGRFVMAGGDKVFELYNIQDEFFFVFWYVRMNSIFVYNIYGLINAKEQELANEILRKRGLKVNLVDGMISEISADN